MWTKSTLPDAPDDGLHTPEVGEWGAEKYLRVWMYDEMFTKSQNRKWTLVYVDLFAGAGHALLKESGRRVLSSAMLALQVAHRFDRYVFCEADPRRMAALRERVGRVAPEADVVFLEGDANQIAQSIVPAIPPGSLAFCFADPYGTNIRLSAIRVLAAARRMDFLILLALGMDANRNKELYRADESKRLDEFLGDATWRERWAVEEKQGGRFQRFLAREYAGAMQSLGYLETALDEMHPVKDRGRLLYHLAFFSKVELAKKLWSEARKYTDPQTGLAL
ncbi:MAG TPA: three-Cys-motif partner protein TcmP [Longimicrobium sp.]